MQRASKRAPQWLRDLGVFILVMGGAVGICMLLSACYDDNNPFATSVFILAALPTAICPACWRRRSAWWA